MYRHILIPTDGSALAERGVAQGLALAKMAGTIPIRRGLGSGSRLQEQ